MSLSVTEAREASRRRDWRAVYHGLQPRRDELGPDGLSILSDALWWLGDAPTSMELVEDVYQRLLADGAEEHAADRAQRLALAWATRGDIGVAMAWMSRAERLLEDLPRGPLHGRQLYLRTSFDMDLTGDAESAADAAAELHELHREHDDPALGCFALVLEGMAAIRRGETTKGFAALDEAMLPVLAGKLDAHWAGDIYCTTIHTCEALADLARMRDWTEALARWSSPLSETFMYANVTRVHELQLVSAEGGWDVVEEELGLESESLVGAHGWLSGTGFYELGEVRRLRGDRDGARAAYARARSFSIDPQPGEALLTRSEGRTADALSALRMSLTEQDELGRARLLLPMTELALEVADRAAAETSAAELEAVAVRFGTPGLKARAEQARALLAIAAGRPADAIPALDRAAAIYRTQRYRHAVATVHEQLARAHRACGDPDKAAADEATARAIYEQLGARAELERLSPRELPGGLTPREAEVLGCLASGASNREVAERLVISEKTVSRHLEHIFSKAGVSTRTAAAAWAREHGL
jgi:DNA-binding NarL/FixJ family response regulator